MQGRILRIWCASLLACTAVSGCADSTNAILSTAGTLIGRGERAEPKLNPDLRYLRMTTRGSVAYIALGYLEEGDGEPVEVWYTSQREVVRLRGGRLVGVVGLSQEWRNVTFAKLPDWHELARIGTYKWTRSRDIMPGYRYGVVDQLTLKRQDPPRTSALTGVSPERLAWFEETLETASVRNALPPARYAVDLDRNLVVYGEQCISPAVCFSWQRWPAGT